MGTIRTFEQMAQVARGIKRMGILRMDVDDLGRIMVAGLKSRTMAATSTLSEALESFFAGWLNTICREVNEGYAKDDVGKDRGDRLYVIYAGGDDLFIVGSWDLMPELAGRIRDDFRAYSGANPDLHISAGITLEGESFPLYQAADRAGKVLDVAKDYSRSDVKKDAITFLDLTVKWDEWEEEVRPRLETITELVKKEKSNGEALAAGEAPEAGKAPAALLRVLQNVYAEYEDQLERSIEKLRDRNDPVPEEPQYEMPLCYGPWMWHEAYALTRMAARMRRAGYKEEAYLLNK